MMTPIPTHLILGFLGVGKSTAILDLLGRKPSDEHWAVLVNEFGEVGVDGAIMEAEGVAVKEVPGGCMCCVAGLPMQVALNWLIRREKPDRLLIEPTGLGHPSQVIETLTGESYQGVLSLASSLCLVDPRRLSEEKVVNNVHFRDQAAVADVLVANKCDLCEEDDLVRFRGWAGAFDPPKARIEETRHGRLELEWLTAPHSARPATAPGAHHHHHDVAVPEPVSLEDEPWQRFMNTGDDHHSCGWRITPETRFAYDALVDFCHGGHWLRIKGVVHTDQGWMALNLAGDSLSATPVEPNTENRLEIISYDPLDGEALDDRLRTVVLSQPAFPSQ